MKIGSMFKEIVVSFFSPPVTENYPFEKPKTANRFRGKLAFNSSKCTGCNLCSKDCPANAIEIIIIDRAAKRFVARYNVDRCIYCAQCIQSCKFKCLDLSKDDWELAALQKGHFEVNYGKEEDIVTLLERFAQPKNEPG
ncbi:MAG: 4Fe-4S binding protein [Burkholderiales bacterium]|nr:4Fe-4S binding protein [Burkholderiales bacterium]